MRFLARTLLVLATLAGLFGVMPIVATQAAPGDACVVSSTLVPGTLDGGGVCVATSPAPAQGFLCSNGSFFSGTQCVPNNSSCALSGGGSGFYQSGVCTAPPSAPTPTAPTAPAGLTLDPNAGGIPSGGLEPMCVNASPFVGGGIGFVSGTVLCYTGAGKNTGIYAYSDTGSGGAAWNPFDIGSCPTAWCN